MNVYICLCSTKSLGEQVVGQSWQSSLLISINRSSRCIVALCMLKML